MNTRVGNDPLEQALANALDAAQIEYLTDFEGRNADTHLDFYLPAYKVYIEVKGGHTDRIAAQMSRAPNIIALQGQTAVNFLIHLLQSANASEH